MSKHRSINFARILTIVVIGGCAGFLSGLFGVGGGMIIVPALMIILDMPQRQAAATSLCAIIITAATGSIMYATQGNVSINAMLLVSLGALIGAQIGVWLLRILPEWLLPWIFVTFILSIIVIQQFHEPLRASRIHVTALSAFGMIAVGVVSGIFAGLVGVGGGGIIVPGLELVVGAGDLIARGTSLLAMIPTALSGTFTSFRYGLVDLRVGLFVGAIASAITPVGMWVAQSISPETGNILFSVFLVFVCVSTVMKARRRMRKHSQEAN
ncbi:sulfite exporter TauE/SafE family protein [Arcanobacterium haemolyticum]|uniref:Probable membrane transporter protein n=1 Tax=Arcanobacterium haemolyticum (strain ATCC 9345 / DSM 20595 / CCM 5947 / CCUG 17215 / LMG 16163 / NBRC 15585 / NCTC 8452 / 11018) TaxID=644284 RepID=D7BNN2_ARCHD|nr:sulfite exporter TauE/SafE family protein [Arcanobacterium haemolyticum]ADH92531.1 protein of unknown function DUF81 [Arcanobacterium haemolyticum DSM 20595]